MDLQKYFDVYIKEQCKENLAFAGPDAFEHNILGTDYILILNYNLHYRRFEYSINGFVGMKRNGFSYTLAIKHKDDSHKVPYIIYEHCPPYYSYLVPLFKDCMTRFFEQITS